jgi:hypothetical protein
MEQELDGLIGMIEDRKITPHEEQKWRAEFDQLGREAVRARCQNFNPRTKYGLALTWLREQERANERRNRWTLYFAAAGAVVGFISMVIGAITVLIALGEALKP